MVSNVKKINDIVIEVATENGSGSQSANNILMRSIFYMGIPVSGKNLFPSNIQGLPTWFSIRVNEEGWVARKDEVDVMVCMNERSVAEDLKKLNAGDTLIIEETLKSQITRDDINIIIVPFEEMVKEICPNARLRRMVVNLLYVGVIAHFIGIEEKTIVHAIQKQFSKKPEAAKLNTDAVKFGLEWAVKNIKPSEFLQLKAVNKTAGKMLVEGNEAVALGLFYGGANVVAWYPITPSSSSMESLIRYLKKYKKSADGKNEFCVVQAEDEISAFGTVSGASWAGARGVTATSGPGTSLMAEGAGLAYFAEIPAVIVDVQRMGPSTGLPTRTNQGDILACYYLSHGDTKHVLLIPGTPEECYQFGFEVMNLAQDLQTVIFLMSDLDLGMNNWMCEPFKPITKEISKGKVLSKEQLEANKGFKRYADVDGDGIPYRTLPGTESDYAAYFTRGTGHREDATYTESSADWLKNIDRLKRKHDTARKMVPESIFIGSGKQKKAIVAYGSSDPAVYEALHILSKNYGLEFDYMRIRALPATQKTIEFIKNHEAVYFVEQNRDGQMISILRSEEPEVAMKIKPILHYDGMSISASAIVKQILKAEGR
jgi:2-oxoglutarate ferredoxin oxidoreductase subunit alpha